MKTRRKTSYFTRPQAEGKSVVKENIAEAMYDLQSVTASILRHAEPESAYAGMSLDKLVTYCVYIVKNEGHVCTVERLVYECFTRFPKKFSLLGHPYWPDSERVTKSWRRCRTDFGWIEGSNILGFRITSAGRQVAKEVENALQNRTSGFKKPVAIEETRRSYELEHLKRVRSSPMFQEYLTNSKNFLTSEVEFRQLLMCNLETPGRILRQNLRELQNIAKNQSDSVVVKFLNVLEERFRKVLQRR